MKKILLFSILFTIIGLVNGQNNKLNQTYDRLAYSDDFSVSKNSFSSFFSETKQNTNSIIKLNNSENAPGRDFFRKEMMKQGTLKSGTAIGSSKSLISGADVLLFDSEVINSTIPFIKSTQTPFITMEFEYMLTDQFALGVLGGYTQSESSNRDSDGVNTKTDVSGYIAGGYLTMYRPLTSWLYLPLYTEFIYNKGILDATDGLKKEKYEYQSMRPSIGTGLSLVFAEYIQLDLRGVDISYSTIEFVQTQKVDANGSVQRIDQKIKNSKIELASNPRFRLLFHVFRVGGGNSNR